MSHIGTEIMIPFSCNTLDVQLEMRHAGTWKPEIACKYIYISLSIFNFELWVQKFFKETSPKIHHELIIPCLVRHYILGEYKNEVRGVR